MIPSDTFNLFWTIWNGDASKFRARHFLVFESLLIHHPQATVIVISSTLNDTKIFFPFRQRGYRIYALNYPQDILQRSLLYRYGGTYLDMDMIILRPLPLYGFLGSNVKENCSFSSLMRLRPGQTNLTRMNVTMALDPLSIFDQVDRDTSLQLADLSKRFYSISLSDQQTNQKSITKGSLIDLLLHRYDLGELRSTVHSSVLIHPMIYIDTRRKQGRFIGHDVIYLRIGKTNRRWNMTVDVTNGTILLPNGKSLNNLNQAEVNLIFNQMIYQSFVTTSIDTLNIRLDNANESIHSSSQILVFHQWVSILTKTMGTLDRWTIVQRFVTSVDRYFPGTAIHIASDSGQIIDRELLLNSTTIDSETKDRLVIHDLPEDSGLSHCRNALINQTRTPFFFIADDDFVFQEDSHLDLLLELISSHSYIDIIAGKIPEDIKTFHDYSGIFLYYNHTLELINDTPSDMIDARVFPRKSPETIEINPCRQVDFVPNAFLGRTEAVNSVRWDDQFKLAEHEDFFLRFGQANRTVFTCRYVSVHHWQERWWKQVKRPYYQKRARVYQYYKMMLIKHQFRRLITFDMTNLDLDETEKQ